MNPTKAKDLLPEVAREMDVPLEFTRDLTEFYWGDIYRTTRELKDMHILVYHIGTFHIKGDKILTILMDKIHRLGKLKGPPPRTSKAQAIYYENLSNYEKLKALRDDYFKEVEKKKKNKELRREFNNKSTKEPT